MRDILVFTLMTGRTVHKEVPEGNGRRELEELASAASGSPLWIHVDDDELIHRDDETKPAG